MQPTNHKTFDTPAALTKWRDAQPAGTEIISITNHEDQQICYYRAPEPNGSNRDAIVGERVSSHLNADITARKILGYSDKLLHHPVAQYSLIRNSVRNLKCFSGLTSMEITEALDASIKTLGFLTIEAPEARGEFGTHSRLIKRA